MRYCYTWSVLYCPNYAAVDADSLGLADYREIVKQPMDLSLVASKLEKRKYKLLKQVRILCICINANFTLIKILLQFLQDIELVWGNAMLYNPSDNVVHKDAVFMRSIWHQQILKNIAKEIRFEISTNCTSTPDTRLQVLLAWVQHQFQKIFHVPAPPTPTATLSTSTDLPVAKRPKSHDEVAKDNRPSISTPTSLTPHPQIKISFQSKINSTSIVENHAKPQSAAASSPLPAKAVAPAAAVAPKEVAPAPGPKAFAISSVPVVKVSGPLLRSCSKAVSTILGDPDMIWFLSPGAITRAHKRTRASSATPCPAPLAPYSDRTRMITVC